MAHTIVRKLMWLFLLMCAPMFVEAQSLMHSSSYHNVSLDSIPSFARCAGINCWNLIPGGLVSIFSNLTNTYGINNSCQAFQYSGLTGWVYHSEWGCVHGLQFGNDGNLYGLVGTCGPYNGVYGYYIARWSGSQWTDLQNCFLKFSLASDSGGMFDGIGLDGSLWTSPNYGASLTECSYPSGHGTVSSVAIVNSQFSVCGDHYLVLSDNSLWACIKGVCNQLPGAGTAVAAFQDQVYVIGTDGHGYHLNTSGGWDYLAGQAGITTIAAGGGRDIWSTATPAVAGGSSIYRFSDQRARWTVSYSGSVTSDPNCPEGICATKHHQATLQICSLGICGNGSTMTFIGPGNWSVTDEVDADVFACAANGCPVTESTAAMICSAGGSNHDNLGSQSLKTEVAYSRVAPSQNPTCKASMDKMTTVCFYPHVVQNCVNTFKPDFLPNVVSGTNSNDAQFDVSSRCFSWNHSPWWCLGDLSTTANREYEVYIGSTYCTNNTP